MGGVGGVILPDGGGVDDHAGQPQLLHPRNKADVHPLGEDVDVAIDVPGAEIQLIEHPGHRPGLRRVHVTQVQGGDGVALLLGGLLVHGPLPLQLEGAAHQAQQLRGVGQGGGLLGGGLVLGVAAAGEEGFDPVQQAGLLRLGDLGQGLGLLGGVLDPLHGHRQPPQAGEGDRLRPVVPGGDGVVGRVGGKGEGGLVGDGQGVLPLHPLLPADLQEGAEGVVPVVPHKLGVQGDLIDHLVGHQDLAVPV